MHRLSPYRPSRLQCGTGLWVLDVRNTYAGIYTTSNVTIFPSFNLSLWVADSSSYLPTALVSSVVHSNVLIRSTSTIEDQGGTLRTMPQILLPSSDLSFFQMDTTVSLYWAFLVRPLVDDSMVWYGAADGPLPDDPFVGNVVAWLSSSDGGLSYPDAVPLAASPGALLLQARKAVCSPSSSQVGFNIKIGGHL